LHLNNISENGLGGGGNLNKTII